MRLHLNIFLLLIALFAFAQSAGAQARGNPQEEAEGDEPVSDYEAYTDDEFPDWLHAVRRAEVVLIGAFPITMLFSSLAYDGYKSIASAVADPTGTTEAEIGQLSESERRGVLIAGISVAAVVALVDYLLTRIDPRDAR